MRLSWKQPKFRIMCCCRWFALDTVLNKHIWRLNFHNPPPSWPGGLQTSRSISKTSFFPIIRFHPETLQKLPTATATPAKSSFLLFWKATRPFSCRVTERGGLEFPGPGQQGLSVGLVPFPQGAQQTRTCSLTVCLCGSSKRSCWRKSPFTWMVWSELEGFLPTGLLVAVWRTKILSMGVIFSQELPLQCWNVKHSWSKLNQLVRDADPSLSNLVLHICWFMRIFIFSYTAKPQTINFAKPKKYMMFQGWRALDS